MSRRSFTLVELLIFSAIFAIAMAGIVTVLIAITRVQSSQSSAIEVEGQGQFLIQQVQYYVRTARLVDMTADAATGTLKLREPIASLSIDPTYIYATSGVAYLQQGDTGAPEPLTTGKVIVSDLSFVRHYQRASSSPYGTDSVNFSFTVTENTSNTTQEYTKTFQSSAVAAAPVGKIALIQQANSVPTGNVLSGTTTASFSFADPNESGNLLVVAAMLKWISNNTSTPMQSTTVSVLDTAGDAWTEIANNSYAHAFDYSPGVFAETGQNVIFAAANAKGGANTVRITLGTSSSSGGSVAIYEYRGAATSSPFDASSTRLNASSTMPSSGSAVPSAAADELLFGVLCGNQEGSNLPTAGNGFTQETVGNAYGGISYLYDLMSVEDGDFHMTGPVSAAWNFGTPAATTTATVVTFK